MGEGRGGGKVTKLSNNNISETFPHVLSFL